MGRRVEAWVGEWPGGLAGDHLGSSFEVDLVVVLVGWARCRERRGWDGTSIWLPDLGCCACWE